MEGPRWLSVAIDCMGGGRVSAVCVHLGALAPHPSAIVLTIFSAECLASLCAPQPQLLAS